MSEQRARYHASTKEPPDGPNIVPGAKISPIFLDPFGFVEVIATHLDLSLATMHPLEAYEAAVAAGRHYAKSHSFIDMSAKGSSEAGSAFRMVRRREAGGEAVK